MARSDMVGALCDNRVRTFLNLSHFGECSEWFYRKMNLTAKQSCFAAKSFCNTWDKKLQYTFQSFVTLQKWKIKSQKLKWHKCILQWNKEVVLFSLLLTSGFVLLLNTNLLNLCNCFLKGLCKLPVPLKSRGWKALRKEPWEELQGVIPSSLAVSV